ncbi:MAG: peptide deformylase [Ignavibacteria bacterium]
MSAMKQLPITTYGMEILRKKTKPVSIIDNKFIDIVQDMFYTMDKSYGVGLAAPQVNLNISLAVLDISAIDKYKKQKPMVLINPVILKSFGESIKEEGCLSIPDIRGQVPRPESILLSYNDFDLNKIEVELDGFIARVVQHEIDHLNGKLFIDYLDPEKKKEIKKLLSGIKKGSVITDYPLHIHSKKEAMNL